MMITAGTRSVERKGNLSSPAMVADFPSFLPVRNSSSVSVVVWKGCNSTRATSARAAADTRTSAALNRIAKAVIMVHPRARDAPKPRPIASDAGELLVFALLQLRAQQIAERAEALPRG